ncbi:MULTISPECIES: hypothetical protein [Gordonibacter]|uniref:DUF4179 domain-containing protein n=1 Tax=Gordonibacter faecis TaxID=3047475 RepID=A0ABT7DJ46_9ACTN|nr:hypothetical protein [Gordonibacter sp. KGMB12511]MDJ1649542.1 hypothetical protein [Gordonibacter sp. KGMB12511]
MNEQDFRKQYAALQESIVATPELKERAYNAAQQTGSQQHRKASTPTKRPTRRESQLVRTRRWIPSLAACLVVGALIAAGTPLVSSLNNSPTIALDEATERCGFAVRAYAADGSAPLNPGTDNIVAFDRDLGYRFQGGDDYQMSGFFTGCLFHVEGEGIARVQANLLSGALYRVTYEDVPTDPDDPRRGELASWKPHARGTGEYYANYDFVAQKQVNGVPKISLAKLMGSTIDIPASDDPGITTGATNFGFWTNEGEVPANSGDDPLSPLIDLFDGEKLTVTVTFNDGSVSTQVIVLHAANFETLTYENGVCLTTQIAPSDEAEGLSTARSLYGIIVEADDSPFPLPLDNANDRADEVLPAMVSPRMNDTFHATTEVDGERVDTILPKEVLVTPNNEISFTYRYEDPNYSGGKLDILSAELTMKEASLVLSDTIPNDKALKDCTSVIHRWLNGLAYMNKCSQEVFGYGYNEDGTLTSADHRYTSTTITVTNHSNAAVPLSPDALYSFVIRNNDGTIEIVHTGYDLDFEATGDVLPSENPLRVTIAPGGTVELTILRVLPNYILANENLILMPNSSDPDTQAFLLGSQ